MKDMNTCAFYYRFDKRQFFAPNKIKIKNFKAVFFISLGANVSSRFECLHRFIDSCDRLLLDGSEPKQRFKEKQLINVRDYAKYVGLFIYFQLTTFSVDWINAWINVNRNMPGWMPFILTYDSIIIKMHLVEWCLLANNSENDA